MKIKGSGPFNIFYIMITTAKTKEEIENWFNTNNHEIIIFDCETTELDDKKPEWDQLEIESICLYNGENIIYVGENQNLFQYLVPFFNNIKTLVAHNIVFDLTVLYKTGLFKEWFNKYLDNIKLYDTMVAQHLLDENIQSIGLKELAKIILKKENILTYNEASKFKKTSQEWINYCIHDVVWCKELMDYQKPLLQKENLEKLFYQIEMPFMLSLLSMKISGILIDKDKVNKFSVELKKDLISLTKEMLNELKIPYQTQTTLGGISNIQSPINFNSSQQLAKILFEQLKLPIIENTPGGKPSVGALTIEKLKDKNKFVMLLNKYKTIQKIISGFLEPLPTHICKDGKVRPGFYDVGTKTGRLSSSNPNIQQLPRSDKNFSINVRDCFIADPGYKIFTVDFQGQEIRVMAELSRDPTLIDALTKGKDLHLTIANQFYRLGIPEEALFENHKDYKMYKDKFKEQRQTAKTVTFGLSYGKGAFGFAKDFNITEDAAQLLIDKYFNGMPMLKKAINNSHNILTNRGYITTLVGRRRRFQKTKREQWEGYLKKDYRQCFNFLIQGFSSDMIRIAINNVRKKARERPEFGINLLATVHDELIIAAKDIYIKEVEHLLRESFEHSMKLIVPLPCEIGVGNSYGEAK